MPVTVITGFLGSGKVSWHHWHAWDHEQALGLLGLLGVLGVGWMQRGMNAYQTSTDQTLLLCLYNLVTRVGNVYFYVNVNVFPFLLMSIKT